YRHVRFRAVPLTQRTLLRRLDRRDRAADARLDDDVYVHLRTWLDRLTVTNDYPQDALPLRVLADGERRVDVCRMGRVHTNLTNLARDYRRHLTLTPDAGKLYAIDVKSCQPLLLAAVLKDWSRLAADAKFTHYTRRTEQRWVENKRNGKG